MNSENAIFACDRFVGRFGVAVTDRLIMTVCAAVLAAANAVAVGNLVRRGWDRPVPALSVEVPVTSSPALQPGDSAVRDPPPSAQSVSPHAAFRPPSELDRVLWDGSLVMDVRRESSAPPFEAGFSFRIVTDGRQRQFRIPITY
jgi:hypothetical protein